MSGDAGAVAPTPDGTALVTTIECRQSRTATHGTTHRVIVGADWSVHTPHDLQAERVAAAFGGYTSCLDLVDRAIPALRAAIGVLTRREDLPLRRDRRGEWRVLPASQLPGCCARRSFASVETAARHLRGADHLARRFGAPAWQLAMLLTAAETRWSWQDAPLGERPGARQLVREEKGVATLWTAGIAPDRLPALAAVVSRVSEPLPVAYYLGMVYGVADPDWVRAVSPHRPDGDAAAWLAWTDSPRAGHDSAFWSGWLDLGVALDGVRLAVEQGIDPGRARTVAEATGRPLGIVARDIVRWAAVGCEPAPEQFALLARRGLDHEYPRSAVIDQLARQADRRALSATRTQLGVMLALLGTQRAVLAALADGTVPDVPQ